MANPQRENGYTGIANEIMEELARYQMSGHEYRIILVVLRQTWGWQKKEDEISLSQFAKKAHMDRTSASRAVSKLVAKKLLTSHQNATTSTNIYRFNKDYSKWLHSGNNATSTLASGENATRGSGGEATGGSGILVKRVVAKMPHTKETITKERIKEIIKESTPSEDAIDFFSFGNKYLDLLEEFSKDKEKSLIEQEFKRFCLYWTEKNKSGTKNRWQLEPTFEVKRRLATWFSRINSFSNNRSLTKII